MFWADRIAKEIISSGKYKPYWVDDMKTPSGFAHIGALRGPIIHSLIYRALKDAGYEAKITYIINDFDPADELPPEFREKFKKYLGFPLKRIPSPNSKFKSLGDLIAEDFKVVQRKLGVEAQFLSSYEMYQEGKFDQVIKEALDNAGKIQDIYQKVSGSRKKEKGWLPFQVVCEKCGKVGTNRVYGWDGKEVSYKCEPEMVTWATGCGYTGKINPFGGTGKLPWKVDWAAHWKVIGVTVEGAGKDHASAGGSYDIAMALCKEVFNYHPPFKLPYEWFITGGKKMSSSRGIGFKAHDITSIFPPAVARFLFVRTDYKEAIEFNPDKTIAVPDLYDEYDRCWQAYIKGNEPDLARIFELSQVEKVPTKKTIYLPRFRDVANQLQMPGPMDFEQRFVNDKGSALTDGERDILNERKKYAKFWLENFAPDEFKITVVTELKGLELPELDREEIVYLKEVISLVNNFNDSEKLQLQLYQKSKELKIDSKKAFSSIYKVILGKKFGPKAAWLLLDENKDNHLLRLMAATRKNG